jgi:LPXTG-site transpeptidase (sortase) family protein
VSISPEEFLMKSRSLNLIVLFALFISLIGGAVTTAPVHAASFPVGDAASLILAITTANSNNANDTITLTANITLTAINNGVNGLPVILADSNHSLTIEGNGFAISRSSAGGTPSFRIMEVDTGANLTLNNITISNGYADDGGGILNFGGTLTITNSTVSNNSAVSTDISSAYGGAIFNDSTGTLTIKNSTFTGNSATSLSNSGAIGGAIYNGSGGDLTIINSTFSDNQAIDNGSGGGTGGAIVNNSSTLTIKNSTFSGNSASDSNGGIINGGLSGIMYLENTILANNTANGVGSDCSNSGTLATNINNLIENNDSCGTPSLTADPNLDSLANNGGFTQTMALLPGSPAIDAGNNTVCATSPVSGLDQRGTTRPQGSTCDIGAYEVLGGIPLVTASNPSANAVLTSLSSITVVFNQDMLDNATADGAENVNNYLLVERGANGTFNTVSCNGGLISDDVKQTISTASYSSAGFITSLTLASPLANGAYRLFICGTTSVWSLAGLELNNGVTDTTVDFTIGTGSTTRGNGNRTTASSLPKTGFAPNKITVLPAQPADLAYAKLGDLWLEIPSLNVKSTIVGVPQNKDNSWDVSWLGNDTGWLNGTAFPTWNGNSVLTAHVTNASGLEGPFAALKSLKYGDQVIVHFGGVKYVYEVRVTKLARPYTTNFTFESKQDASYLTLVTCSGYNPLNETYLFRRVVRAVLVSVVNE